MRIVVVTGIDRMSQYFATTLVRRFGEHVAGAVFQRPQSGFVRRRKKLMLWRGLQYAAKHGFSPVRIWRDRRFARMLRLELPDAAATRRRMFPTDDETLRECTGRIWTTYDIHQPETVEAIRRLRPDVICILGGTAPAREIIDIPTSGVINIHTGLIPDYRGVRSAEWAILNDNLENLAATVHFVKAEADRERIIAQEAVEVEADDDEVSLECKLIHAGIERVCDTLLRMQIGGRLTTRSVIEHGRRDMGNHWSHNLHVKLRHKINNGAVRRYVQSRQTALAYASESCG